MSVEHGLVRTPPNGSSATYKGRQTRSQALAALAKSNGADNVLRAWRWVLTSPGETAQWWRGARKGIELVGSFLVVANFAKIFDGWQAERDHGVKLGRRGKVHNLDEYRAPHVTPPEEVERRLKAAQSDIQWLKQQAVGAEDDDEIWY
jgi:hypothetical protein